MLQILAVTGPIYLLIALGFVATRAGVFAKEDLRVLGKFVIQFALPALLFKALSQRALGEILNASYLIAYAAGSLTLLLGGVAFARLVQRKGWPESAFVGMGMSFSNSGFVGYPVVLQLLGPSAAVALALCMVIENMLMLPIVLGMAEAGSGGSANWRHAVAQTFARLLANPMILAILAGFAAALLGLHLPDPLARAIDMLAAASGGVALFVIGGTLVGLRVAGLRRAVARVAFGKLILHPLAVFGFLLLLPPLEPKLRTAAVVFACMPMLSIYPILAQKYRLDGFCAAALLATTVASFFTINLALWLMGAVPGWAV